MDETMRAEAGLTLEQALERLRAKEEELARVRDALEASKVALWDWNLQSNKVQYSAEWARQVGCDPAEIGDSLDEWRRRVHPDDLLRMMRVVPKFLANPWPDYNIEFRMRNKSGEWRWILCHADAIHDEEGRALRMLGSQIDITESKKAEQLLAERESQLAVFIEHCGAPIAMFDREMNYIAASRRWCRDYSIDGPVQGRNHYEIFPDTPERWKVIHRRCLAGAVEKCDEDQFVGADGTVDWLRWQVRPWLGGTGEIGGIVIFSEVITARKVAEESLRRSQLRLQAAIHAGGVGTWIWHVREDRFELDDWIYDVTGRTRGEAGNPSFDSLLAVVDPENAAFIREEFRRALIGEAELDYELKLARPDGKAVWLASKGRVERDASGEPELVIGAVVDITHSRTLEQELLQAQQLDSIGKLAGGVAHDFNNILTVILGQASLMGMRKDLPAPVADSLNEITVAAQRAAELSSQLLAFGRRQVLQVRKMDLNEAVAGAMIMLDGMLGKSIRLEFRREMPRANVNADAELVMQVLFNLAVNARDAMPQGGELTIETSLEHVDANAAVETPGASVGTWICLAITDTGTGIEREILPHVFEPFFTTKGVGNAKGLGLSEVYGIVKQHGGWVAIDTEPGRGTTFRVRLPASEAPEQRAGGPDKAESAPARGHNILIVEDEPAVRTLVRMTLERFGYTVSTADNGEAARELWHERRGDFDLLLTDVVMPGGVTGPQLVASLREQNPDLKVILSSGHGADIVGDRFEWRSDAVFLQKPYDIQNLVSTVQRLLDAH